MYSVTLFLIHAERNDKANAEYGTINVIERPEFWLTKKSMPKNLAYNDV